MTGAEPQTAVQATQAVVTVLPVWAIFTVVCSAVAGTVAAALAGLFWWEIRQGRQQMKKALYREDGITLFMPREECERQITRCNQQICGQINEFKKTLEAFSKAREEELKYQREIAQLLGQVKEHLKHNGRT